MLILTVVRRQVAPLAVPLFGKAAARVWGEDTARRQEELREVASILETGLGIKTRRMKISDGSLVGFYASLLTGELRDHPRSPYCLLAEDAAGASVQFGKSVVEIEEGTPIPKLAAVLYVKSYAKATWPGMLDALGAAQDTIIAHSYTPIEHGSIAERVKRRVAQMRSAEDIAATVEAQLFEAADKSESGELGFGVHQMTITIFAGDQAALDTEVARIRGIAHQNGMRLVREVTALEAAFFAMHPGNMDYRARDMTVSSLNFADKRPMFYYRPENFKMLLLALLSLEFGDTKDFVFDKLKITELSGFLIRIKKPDVNWAKGKKAKDVWGAKGAMKDFVVLLGQLAKYTIIADDDNSIEFSFPSMERLYSLKNHFGEEKDFLNCWIWLYMKKC